MPQQYDSRAVHVILDGRIVTGFAEDSMVTAQRIEDKIELQKGAKGEGTFVINANDGGEVTISLAHNSPILPHLNSLFQSNTIFNVDIMDANSDFRETAGGSDAMISNIGPMGRGGSVSDREVSILVDDYENTILG